ncbi:histidine phosphatase family protein [Lysinibacillus sp. NPDC097195]|uniref:histidine phosphatase family protein n=1 Tax=Lysinibacillus sp. NPDC097195 TaxID=3364141 RepID=UPI0038068653
MHTTMIMIRHAESPFIIGEERTRPLSLKGERDVHSVTALIGQTINVIASSPYKRAIQTVEGIAKKNNLEVQLIENLKERTLKGEYRLSEEEIDNAIKKSFEDADFSLQEGESIIDVQNRAIPAIKNLLKQYEGKTIIIGTHGNIMTIIMNYFNEKYGYDFWKSTTKPDIYKLIFSQTKLVDVQRIWQE